MRLIGAVPVARSRLMEWSLVAVVIIALALAFAYYASRVRGQGELAAIRLTVGALRSTLAIEDLRQKLPHAVPSTAPIPYNPFELLRERPGNYRGEVADAQSASALTTPGNWVYERTCACIAYRPLDTRWLESPSGDALLWFYVLGPQREKQTSNQGPLQLVAREAYRWQGQLID
jgi:hypothetical protein